MIPEPIRVPGDEPWGVSKARQGGLTGPLALGRIAMTGEATMRLADANVPPSHLLLRHRAGDWGDIPPQWWADNNLAAVSSGQVVSCYNTPAGAIWIVTERDSKQTTLMTPEQF